MSYTVYGLKGIKRTDEIIKYLLESDMVKNITIGNDNDAVALTPGGILFIIQNKSLEKSHLSFVVALWSLFFAVCSLAVTMCQINNDNSKGNTYHKHYYCK
ncbi:MAG: hypothetical protein IPJ32_04545 [Sphingobacteriaceae bacterium]|nr:hypothetical protein [Sphingobacteriaceae bacterium]